LIYDAAHAFGARYAGRSLPGYGDLSTLSFHATKLFHTVEGGAIVVHDAGLADRLGRLRNFGYLDPVTLPEPGINAKMSEVHAAMGLCLLPRVPDLIAVRRRLCGLYDEQLVDAAPRLTRPAPRAGTEPNYAYYPVMLESEDLLHRVREALEAADIIPRRYFHPCLSTLPYVTTRSASVSRDRAGRVLCLPLWTDLPAAAVERIAGIVRRAVS
jgi:dTDP-4-amino-4,6-dideoxygalactose transaminase